MQVTERIVVCLVLASSLVGTSALAAPKSKGSAQPAPAPAPAVKALPPAAAAKPAKPSKFDAPVEVLPVPETGPLDLEQLILLGTYNNMKILKARMEADVARAERRAATDWKDPEIRLSYSKQTDIEVGSPYTEYSKGTENYRGNQVDRQHEFGSRDYAGESQFDFERTHYTESRYQTIERRVTPGAKTDKEVETIYEQRQKDSSTSRNRNEISVDHTGNNAGTVSALSGGTSIQQSTSRKIVGKKVTYTNHEDVTSPEDQFGILLRFPLPNPIEMMAKVQRANAEIKARDYAVKAEEDKLIMEIRSLYEDLAYYEAQQKSFSALADHQAKFTELAKLIAPDKIANAAGNANDNVINAGDASLKAGMKRAELAQLVGLRDFERISVPKTFRQRVVDAKAMNEDYLLQMASIYRSDLQQLHAQHEVASAEYKMERAAKVPVASGLDFGMTNGNDYRGRDTNEFQVRLSVSLPLWSWLMNDADKVPLAQARGVSRQIGRLQENISGDIHSSLSLLRSVQSNLEAYEKSSAALQLLMKNEGTMGAGFSKNPQEVISESEEAVLKGSIQRLQIYRNYNIAVMHLEAALGTRLEKILTPQVNE